MKEIVDAYAASGLEPGPLVADLISIWEKEGVDDEIERLQEALDESDEVRPYLVSIDGYDVGVVLGQTAEEALDKAEELCTPSDGADSTVYAHVRVYSIFGEDSESRVVSVDPEEPPCSGESHDWVELSRNGHGGGVQSWYACTHCGLRCFTDSWATDPATGMQGLDYIRYEPPDADSIALVVARVCEDADLDDDDVRAVVGAYPWDIDGDVVGALIDAEDEEQVDDLLYVLREERAEYGPVAFVLERRLDALGIDGVDVKDAVFDREIRNLSQMADFIREVEEEQS